MAKYHEMLLNKKSLKDLVESEEDQFLYFDLQFWPLMTSEVKSKGIDKLKITHKSYIIDLNKVGWS